MEALRLSRGLLELSDEEMSALAVRQWRGASGLM
jgi:hypothetical protein